MKYITGISAIVLIIFIYGFTTPQETQDNRKENRDVAKFTKIDLSIPGNIQLRQGSEQKLEIEADDEILKIIDTKVKGNTLQIEFTKRRVRNAGKITIYITIPEFEALHISGSGSMAGIGDISSNDIDLDISGSGNIEMENLTCNELDIDISGSGKIELNKGKANSLDFDSSGSGRLYANNYKVKTADIGLSGNGKCKVFVTENLDAQVSGSGSVYYKGSPIINSSISGSGNISSL